VDIVAMGDQFRQFAPDPEVFSPIMLIKIVDQENPHEPAIRLWMAAGILSEPPGVVERGNWPRRPGPGRVPPLIPGLLLH